MIGKIIMKTCESCKILRDNGIAHFDLKNQNMMFKWTNKPEMESFLIDFGKEFMPAMDEGSTVIIIEKNPSISLEA